MLQRYHFEYTTQGFVTSDQFGVFEEIYESYHALGGNGRGTHMWEDIKALPIRNDLQGMVNPFALVYKEIMEEKQNEQND